MSGIVETTSGRVLGSQVEGIWQFLGVPYGASPRGPRRFRPPAPPAPWAGVREATAYPANAPQPASGLGSYVPGDPMGNDEDCLALNVWSPDLSGSAPVMVFLHGGAFSAGSGSQVMYDGGRIAARAIVVVTINYRLGVLGFLAHPALADETSGGFGNWGLHDQIAALRWVRDNVASFGGDPHNVTLFGESAGAMSACDLLGAPEAAGLFHRVIAESGAHAATPVAPAVTVAEAFAAESGLDPLTRAGAERLPVAGLIAAQTAVSARIDGGYGIPFRPVVDGGLFSEHPAVAVAAGAAAPIDLLVGTNRDEFRFFSFVSPEVRSLDGADLARIVGRYLEGAGMSGRLGADVVVDVYREARAERGEATSPRDLLDAFATDFLFRIPVLRLAAAHTASGGRTYVYEFDWTSPFADGALGACHALELPFVFGSLRNEVVGLFTGNGPEALTLSDTIQEAWSSFARTGQPSADRLDVWEPYGRARTTMRLGSECGTTGAPRESERSFWELHLGRYGVDGPIEAWRPPGVALLAPETGHATGT